MSQLRFSSPEDLFYLELIQSYIGAPRFITRPWLEKEVEEVLSDPTCRFLLLTGAPGAGKTAFMAWMAQQHVMWSRYFIRRDQRTPLGDVGARSLLLQIGFQLAASYPPIYSREEMKVVVEQRIGTVGATGEVIAADIEKIFASPFYQRALQIQQQVAQNNGKVTAVRVGEWVTDPRLLSLSDLQFMALIDPARVLGQSSGEQIVILVDALDELRYRDTEQTLLSWLTTCPELPANVRFVLTSRPDDGLLRLFREAQRPWLKEMDIAATDANVLLDLRTYALALAEEQEVKSALKEAGREVDDFVNLAIDRASGNIGYLDTIGRAIDQVLVRQDRQALLDLLDLSRLPDTLEELYAFFLHQLKELAERRSVEVEDTETGQVHYVSPWSAVYRHILGILVVARESLTTSEIWRLGGIQVGWGDMSDAMSALRQFLNLEGDHYHLYHTTLIEFLTAEETKQSPQTQDLYLEAAVWHRKIVTCYGGKADEVGWGKANLEQIDEYGLAHLAAHLRLADWSDKLHALIGERWARVHEKKQGSLAGFLRDVDLAWGAAESANDTGLMIRYALFEASVRGLASNLPPPLICALFEHEVWTAEQTLSSAVQATDDEQRVGALLALAPKLTQELFAEAFDLARSLVYASDRVEPLAAMIASAPFSLRDQVVAETMKSLRELGRAFEFARITDKLAESNMGEALEIAQAFHSVDERCVALAALLPHLPGNLLPQAGAAVDALVASGEPPSPEAVEALAALARRLEDNQCAAAWRSVLEATLHLENQNDTAKVLSALSSDWPAELLPEVLESAMRLTRPYAQAEVAAALLPVCPSAQQASLLNTGLAAVRQLGGGTDPIKTRALAAFLPALAALPEEKEAVLHMALAESRDDTYNTTHVIGLALLLPHIAGAEQDALQAEALEYMRQPDNSYRRAEALTVLTPELPLAARGEMVELAIELDDEEDQVRALTGMAEYLTPEQIGKALNTAPNVKDDTQRYLLLAGLASWLPASMLPQALTVARALRDQDEQAHAIIALARLLSLQESPITPEELLARAASITPLGARTETLFHLIGWLPEPLNDRAWNQLVEALRACDSFDRRHTLQLLSAGLPPSALEAILSVIDGLWSSSDQAEALLALAPALPDARLPQLVESAFALVLASSRGEALARLVPRLPAAERADALRRVLAQDETRKESDRADTLVPLALVLTPEEAVQVLDAAKAFGKSNGRSEVLAALLPRLPADRQPEAAFEVVTSLPNAEWSKRVEIFEKLADGGFLSNDLVAKSLESAREIGDPVTRSKALAALLPALGKEEQSTIAVESITGLEKTIADPDWMVSPLDRFEILFRLAPYRSSVPRWFDLFWEAYNLSYAHWRAEALIKLTEFVPMDEWPGLLARSMAEGAMWLGQDVDRYARERTNCWGGLIDRWQQLPTADAYQVWHEGLRALAARPRPDLLLDLAFFAPVVNYLGSTPAVSQAMKAIEEVCNIWP